MQKVYDKASWHIDNGCDKFETIKKFENVLLFLNDNSLLSDDGKEIFGFGVDSSISITERMLNKSGNEFMTKYYDSVINESSAVIGDKLSVLYRQFREKLQN